MATEIKNTKIGSCLVLGGGIAGMQAALDLANSGIKVYLVDTRPSIGGVMAMLDKTFPTNDCAMCTMAPRLVEIGRHKDIEIITLSDIESISGQAGNFTVRLNKHARYVREDRCTGCGECETACPVEVPDGFNCSLNQRKAIYRLYPQAVPNWFTIDKSEHKSPCRLACSAGCDNQAYIALISQGRFKEAMEVIRRRIPIPSICGRICNAPCESKCNRKDVDEPLSIRALKRFVSDYERVNGGWQPSKVEVKYPEKIAVIGSGPAGLTCAYNLTQRGYPVTIFEALPVAGGMLRVGIPQYRLPAEIIDYEIEQIKNSGVEILTNTPLGPDLTLNDLFDRGYKAIFIAIGMHQSKRLNIEGEDLAGVVHGTSFLHSVKRHREIDLTGKVVAVIGGGNVATDVARTVLRLGAEKVSMVCMESLEEMPAHPQEIKDAKEEGITILHRKGTNRILGKDGSVCAIELIECLSVFDKQGRFSPVFARENITTMDADTVIIAVGQVVDYSMVQAADGVLITERGFLKVDKTTLATNVPGIFAGGDVIGLSGMAVDAIAHGHEAAESIHRYLQGMDMFEGREKKTEAGANLPQREIKIEQRQPMPKLLPQERIKDFEEIELGYSQEQAVKEAKRCLNCGGCSECLMCVQACKAEAIEHQQKQEAINLEVGAVIIAPGYETFEAKLAGEYGYGRYPNVVTSLEFERIMGASGPFRGEVLRPSDKTHPHKIAFIQCVGSRDTERPWCSSVCCMYATKEAIIAKEHLPDLECKIFYRDVRAFGKGYEAYYERAKKEGIAYINQTPSTLKQNPQTKGLVIRYGLSGEIIEEEFDLVVLCVGITPQPVKAIAQRLNLRLNEFGFVETDAFLKTNLEGIFAAGVATGPKDIPESVMEASASAAECLAILSDVKWSLVKKQEYPPQRDVTQEEPRVGVFVCHCGTNIAGVVDVNSVVEYVRRLPNVVHCENRLYTCSSDSCERIKEVIQKEGLNRVVVAACTPRTHEPLFMEVLRNAGLNPYLFEMANIRDQNSWVHRQEPQKATQKAKDLIKMALAKVRMNEPLYPSYLTVNKSALVIGAGIAGLTASIEIARQGYQVHLIEKNQEIGGYNQRIKYLLGAERNKLWEKVVSEVKNHPKIKLYLNTQLVNIEGSVGNFKTQLAVNGTSAEIEHGVVIVATGATEYKPTEYLYGQDKRVITQLELEERLANLEPRAPSPEPRVPNTVVMLQCVGSREEERMYCSRVCCQEAIKNGLKIKEVYPQTDVYIIYRDIRAYGYYEEYYRQAREKGIKFIQRQDNEKPQVELKNGQINVSVLDMLLGMKIDLPADLVVLSSGTQANESNKDIAQKLKVSLNEHGFFLEAHMKLRPVDFATEGIFVCGTAHGPKTIPESIIQAMAAAARASVILSKDELEIDPRIAEVIDANCDGCAYCVDPCPYKAITLVEYEKDGAIKKTVKVDIAKCHGCGVCMATCPKKGIFVRGFRLEQIAAQVEAALEEVGK
ncbi:MAG: FAD-dependent oxidoreductase [bacterium]